MSENGAPSGDRARLLLERRRLGARFAALILCFYFGFALLMAFAPKALAVGAPFSVGFALIVLHIAAIILLNARYMKLAQRLEERE